MKLISYLALPSILLLCALAAPACVDDEPYSLGTVVEDIKKSDIEDLGGWCVPIFGEYQCVVCTVHYPLILCHYYECSSEDADCTKLVFDAAGTEAISLWFEAEGGTLTAPMQTFSSSAASNGSLAGVSTAAGSGGAVTFTFTVPAGGATFYPWARTQASSTATNTWQYRIDSGAYTTYESPITGTAFRWSRMTTGGITIAAGTHTLRLARVDAGVAVDRVLLTTDPLFIPVADTYQAESGAVVAPMVTGTQGLGMSQIRYRWVPNGGGTGGLFDVDIEPSIMTDGAYTVWARTNAASSADNSFYMSANLGPQALWNLPITTATGWAWGHVTDANLGGDVVALGLTTGSFNFLRFFEREDGAKIDKIIVTNDPGFAPVDVP